LKKISNCNQTDQRVNRWRSRQCTGVCSWRWGTSRRSSRRSDRRWSCTAFWRLVQGRTDDVQQRPTARAAARRHAVVHQLISSNYCVYRATQNSSDNHNEAPPPTTVVGRSNKLIYNNSII